MTHTVFCATWNNPLTGARGATSCGTIDELLDRVGPLFEDPTMVVNTSVLDANGIEIPIDVMHLRNNWNSIRFMHRGNPNYNLAS
jgi:hypothetical protein